MKIENLSNIEIYGRKLSDFLLPDQIEILCREINKDCPLEEESASKDVDLEAANNFIIKKYHINYVNYNNLQEPAVIDIMLEFAKSPEVGEYWKQNRHSNKDYDVCEHCISFNKFKDNRVAMPTDEEIKECSQLDKVIHFLRRRLNPKITIDQEIKLTAGEIACYLVDFSVQSNRQLLVEYETWKTDNDIKNLLPDQLADWYIEIITNLKRIKTT